MADNNTIARPYARAAFELASERQDLAGWSAALNDAKCLLADGQVVKLLANPALTAAQKLEFLTGLFNTISGQSSLLGGSDRLGSNFLRLLLEYGRVAVLPEIAEQFDALKENVENSVTATLTSAATLNEQQVQEVTAALERRFGCNVSIETAVDENLIGGAVIRAGDVVIDGSLRAKLEGLATALIK